MSQVFGNFVDVSDSTKRGNIKDLDTSIKDGYEIQRKGQLQIAPYHKYVPRIKTTNSTFNPTNSNNQIKDYYNFKVGYPDFNKKLTEIYENNDYQFLINRSQHTLKFNETKNLVNQLWSYQLPSPVNITEDKEALSWSLDFEIPSKSKIFSDVRPDLSNTCFTLKENVDIQKETHAYTVLYFPESNGATGNSYLLPTLMVGWMLRHFPQNWSRKQKGLSGTAATTICLITPDVTDDERKLLSEFYDKLVEAPYITWNTELKTNKILIRDLSQGAIPSGHVYDRVTTKLWIFDPDHFPYEKVILLDSDLFPLGYFDTLFSIETPAGWLEHQRRQLANLGVSSWISDRGTRLRHGEAIPEDLTESGNLHASDLNASLLVVKPDKETFQNMINDLQTGTNGANILSVSNTFLTDINKGAWAGDKYYPFYLLPEQNYLTNYFSGKWHSLDLGFSTWCIDLEHCFGFTFAGFNVKPWSHQSLGHKYSLNPYSRFSEINNRETNRSLGLQYFNLLLVKMILDLPVSLQKEVSNLIKLNLVDHPFDPWEPEIDIKTYKGVQPLLNYFNKQTSNQLSPDQLLLGYTILNLEERKELISDSLNRLLSTGLFVSAVQELQPLGVVALNYVYLKFALQLIRSQRLTQGQVYPIPSWSYRPDDYYLASPTLLNWIPLKQNSLQITLEKSLWTSQFVTNMIRDILDSGCFRVFLSTVDPRSELGATMQHIHYQIVDDSKNLPLDYFCQLKPPEAKFLTLDELTAEFTHLKPQSFNFSLSEPVWQELQSKVNSLEIGKEQNLIFGHNHYTWRPHLEFTYCEPSPTPYLITNQYLDYVNEFVQVARTSNRKLNGHQSNGHDFYGHHSNGRDSNGHQSNGHQSNDRWSALFIHTFRSEIGQLYRRITEILKGF